MTWLYCGSSFVSDYYPSGFPSRSSRSYVATESHNATIATPPSNRKRPKEPENTSLKKQRRTTSSEPETCTICLCEVKMNLSAEPLQIEDTIQKVSASKPVRALDVCESDAEIASTSRDEENGHIIKTNCHHTFHKKCLNGWRKISATCPTCRQHLYKNSGE